MKCVLNIPEIFDYVSKIIALIEKIDIRNIGEIIEIIKGIFEIIK